VRPARATRSFDRLAAMRARSPSHRLQEALSKWLNRPL
jgi:hypothetical protein